MALINTIIGAAIALTGSFGVEAFRTWQKKVADWKDMQVSTITELQELLCTIKDEIARGKPVGENKASSEAPSEWDLEMFAPRTRARMLCSRLEDQKLRKDISKFLADIKNSNAPWRTDSTKWYEDQVEFTNLTDRLGSLLHDYEPWTDD